MKIVGGVNKTEQSFVVTTKQIIGGRSIECSRSYDNCVDLSINRLIIKHKALLQIINESPNDDDMRFYIREIRQLLKLQSGFLNGTTKFALIHNMNVLICYIEGLMPMSNHIHTLFVLGCASHKLDIGAYAISVLSHKKRITSVATPNKETCLDTLRKLQDNVTTYINVLSKNKKIIQTVYESDMDELDKSLSN